MKKIFAQICLCFPQITYKQQALMFILKFTVPTTIVKNQGVCMGKYHSPNISNKSIHARVTSCNSPCTN